MGRGMCTVDVASKRFYGWEVLLRRQRPFRCRFVTGRIRPSITHRDNAMIRASLPGLFAGMTLTFAAHAAAPLPAPSSEGFCIAVQQIMASTAMVGNNEIFTDMPAYRHSKPSVDPLNIYQVVTYRGQTPIMVSCKVKGAAHLRSAFGEDVAGEQFYCPDVAARLREQAVAELEQLGLSEAAAKAKEFVLVDNEPYTTGRSYLADFELSYVGDDGRIHINSPGLFQDYDSWVIWILPEKFEGQVYCHLATVNYIKALATGEMKSGTKIGTTDDAPVTPGAPLPSSETL